MFLKAQKRKAKLRILLEGVSGSGKTYSALLLASSLGGKIALIDSEQGSSNLYSDEFDFDVCTIEEPYAPEKYIKAIKEAEKHQYNIIILDSISHEWNGPGGCLDIQSSLGGRYQDWAKVTPRHNAFVATILNSKCHIIATARTKTDYAMESQPSGKYTVQKVGLKTQQRDEMDYEFTTVLRLNHQHMYECSKDRSGLFINKQAILTNEEGKRLLEWLNSGAEDLLATSQQIVELNELVEVLNIDQEICKKWLTKANVNTFQEMESIKIQKCIDSLKEKIK